jgi:proteasome accessory factor B
MNEFEISRRTVARDLDFLRDEERAPLAYDDARHGFRLTDETYTLSPVRISRKEAFSFGLARKLSAHYEGTPLHLDMRSVLDKIAESLEGDISCRHVSPLSPFTRMGMPSASKVAPVMMTS